MQSTRSALKNGSIIPQAARQACEERLQNAERVLESNARPEQTSEKLAIVKIDAVVAALNSLGEAAKRCK